LWKTKLREACETISVPSKRPTVVQADDPSLIWPSRSCKNNFVLLDPPKSKIEVIFNRALLGFPVNRLVTITVQSRWRRKKRKIK